MAIYNAPTPSCDSSSKADGSPVTLADIASEGVISRGLKELAPHIPVISEEAYARGSRPQHDGQFWLVDPLDGTREFLSRNGEFTINIALIEDGEPVLGVVYAPALDTLYCGSATAGAFMERGNHRRPIACRMPPERGLHVLVSRSHSDARAVEAYLGAVRVCRYVLLGSSLKFCAIAAGEADLYPRLGRTMEWDTAAGHAVLLAAGGRVDTLDGQRLRYGKPGYENPHFCAKSAK